MKRESSLKIILIVSAMTFTGLLADESAKASGLQFQLTTLEEEASIAVMDRLAGLRAEVAALPAANSGEQLKKEVLVWALEETSSLAEAGMTDRALALIADVKDGLSRELGRRQPALENLFPNIPDIKQNPVLQSVGTINKLAGSTERFPKGKEGDVTKTTAGGWRFPQISSEGLWLAEWLCHPQSPLAGDAALIAPMFRRFSAVYEYLVPGSNRLADFGTCGSLAEMYLLVKTVYPDLILPSLKTRWEAGIECNADAIMARYGQVFLAAKPGTAYPNGHVHYITALLISSQLFDRPDCRVAADGGIRLLETSVFPDGAFTYIEEQNEVFTYHSVTIVALARYWQLSGSETARRIIEATKWYYPLSIEPGGVAEYSTAASWKPYWNTSKGGDAAAIVASLTGDAQNARLANWEMKRLPLAAFYRDGLPVAAPFDNYVAYDRNIQGPRGRFGEFSFCGTGRASPGFTGDLVRDRSTKNRGKSTYVGCMAMVSLGTPITGQESWRLSAALQDATSEVRIAPGDGGITRWDTHAFLSQNDRNATTVSPSFAALTTRYLISDTKGRLLPWAGEQAWIFTPERLVGLVAVEALDNTDAYGVDGTMKLVSGRGWWGTRKEFKNLAVDTLGYGSLVVLIHQHDYDGISTEYTDTFGGDTLKSGRILLLDSQAAAASETNLIHYRKGTRHFYLVEIRPEWSKPAESIQQSRTDDGLITVEVRESDRTLRLVYNPMDKELDCQVDPAWLGGSVTLHRSGEQYRPDWLPRDDNAEAPAPRQLTNQDQVISVPAQRHLIFESKK
jgi:hypothetical protein